MKHFKSSGTKNYASPQNEPKKEKKPCSCFYKLTSMVLKDDIENCGHT